MSLFFLFCVHLGCIVPLVQGFETALRMHQIGWSELPLLLGADMYIDILNVRDLMWHVYCHYA